jgi:molecular chaperone GrpE
MEKQDLYIRKVAEFENYRRRRDREFEELIQSANGGLISRLLPVLENFERALNHGESSEGSDAYRKGVEMIVSQFKEALRREGMEAVESVGQTFDPNLHEALMQVPSEAYEAGVVCEEIERGYRLGDRVIRHAKVVVSLGKPDQKVKVEDTRKVSDE